MRDIQRKSYLSLDIYYSSSFVEYLLYSIACCLLHLLSSVHGDSCFISTSGVFVSES